MVEIGANFPNGCWHASDWSVFLAFPVLNAAVSERADFPVEPWHVTCPVATMASLPVETKEIVENSTDSQVKVGERESPPAKYVSC